MQKTKKVHFFIPFLFPLPLSLVHHRWELPSSHLHRQSLLRQRLLHNYERRSFRGSSLTVTKSASELVRLTTFCKS